MPSAVWVAVAILAGAVALALAPLAFLLLVAAVRPDSTQAALKLVLTFAEQGRINRFGWYCVALGVGFLIYLAVGGR